MRPCVRSVWALSPSCLMPSILLFLSPCISHISWWISYRRDPEIFGLRLVILPNFFVGLWFKFCYFSTLLSFVLCGPPWLFCAATCLLRWCLDGATRTGFCPIYWQGWPCSVPLSSNLTIPFSAKWHFLNFPAMTGWLACPITVTVCAFPPLLFILLFHASIVTGRKRLCFFFF